MNWKIAAAIIVLCVQPLWAGTYYQRPTSDTDGGSFGVCHANAGTGPNYNASSSASAVYSGKSGLGPTGSSVDIGIVGNDPFPDYLSRTFNTWQSEQPSPISLTLNVNTACNISDGGDNVGGSCFIFYSLNGGSTWTTLYTYSSTTTSGDAQTTHSATITGTSVSSVEVNICTVANRDDPGNGNAAEMTTFDIWTTEVTANGGFPGVIRSSIKDADGPCWIDERLRRQWRLYSAIS
jgi:hypothetical protein